MRAFFSLSVLGIIGSIEVMFRDIIYRIAQVPRRLIRGKGIFIRWGKGAGSKDNIRKQAMINETRHVAGRSILPAQTNERKLIEVVSNFINVKDFRLPPVRALSHLDSRTEDLRRVGSSAKIISRSLLFVLNFPPISNRINCFEKSFIHTYGRAV